MRQLKLSKAFTLIEPGPLTLVTTHDGAKSNTVHLESPSRNPDGSVAPARAPWWTSGMPVGETDGTVHRWRRGLDLFSYLLRYRQLRENAP